jgi:hypothetical protein
MTDVKYQIIHLLHMGLVLQITQLSVETDCRKAYELEQLVTVWCVAINIFEQRFMTQHKSLIDHWPMAIYHSSEEGCFITWTQAGHQFVEKSYVQNRFYIAETFCCIMTCS